jgi:hypothetical protein
MTALEQEDLDRMAWADAQLTRRRIEALSHCSMTAGGADRRFICAMSRRAPESLDDAEMRQLLLVTWKYRRKIAPALAPTINPSDPFADPRTGTPTIEARHGQG